MVKKTYNPIKREEEYQNGFMPVIPIPAPKCAIILLAKKAGSGMLVLTEHSRIKKSDIKKGKYDYLAEIDTHQYNIQIEFKATSSDQISDFTVSFSGVAEVIEPDVVYREQIRNVAQHIENGILAEIQSMAADCRISERDFLKQNIENRFGAQVYIDSGISVSNINVLIKSDEQYERLMAEKRRIQYQRELDQMKSEAANEAKQQYGDAGTASFKEYIDGNITVSEAKERWREEEERDFNMRIHQAKEIIKIGQQLEGTDWEDKDVIERKASQVLQGLLSSGENTSSGGRISMNTEDVADSQNIYRELED